MKIIGVILAIVGFLIMLLGGLGMAIYFIYDLIMNFDTLSGGELFWHIVWFLLRDLIAFVVGIVLLIVGTTMVND